MSTSNRAIRFTIPLCAFLAFLALPVIPASAQTSAFLALGQRVGSPAGFAGVCDRYSWACAQRVGSGSAQVDFATALRVNRDINRRVREVSDQRQYNRDEYWALPTARGGDCEDFALLKKRELIRLGFDPKRLMIATVLDRKRRQHAVLVMRTGQGDYVLDNQTDRVVHWANNGYTYLRVQDPQAKSRWRALFAGGLFAANKR